MEPRVGHSLRSRRPELEIALARDPALGYEPVDRSGVIHCLEHGWPTPLARWHYHDEYELHLIVATAGKAFVGDWIGTFEPGHLVLTGPRLPHNWVTWEEYEAVPVRDLVIQFPHEPIARVAASVPEFAKVLGLLERARHGIEFFDMGDQARSHWMHVRRSCGAHRFAAFCAYLADLATNNDYRLLSGVHLEGVDDASPLARVDAVVHRIAQTAVPILSAADVAAELGMTLSGFSRMFRRATGNTFTRFVNRLRVNRACVLLMESDTSITDICYGAGFNNVANFNRRFLDIKGMTPREYRRQTQNRFGHDALTSAPGISRGPYA